MQVEPMKPTFKAPGSKRLKLNHEERLSSLAFNFNLRHYSEGGEAAAELSRLRDVHGVHRLSDARAAKIISRRVDMGAK